MKKQNQQWSIRKLLEKIDSIEFPEYQREPTVWDLNRKRKLIDSILRKFDIASIYLYLREDETYDCIDGQQRIKAIISFLGLNEGKDEGAEDRHNNKFKFTSSDELLGVKSLEDFNGKTWEELNSSQKDEILDYNFNVIQISDVRKDEELNLMFLRLQLGSPLNAGEKLKAMMGDMKDFVFKGMLKNPPLGNHDYFDKLKIPKRRFSKELTASQIAINFFSLQKGTGFKKARFVDLQEFFKEYQKFQPEDNKVAKLLYQRLDEVHNSITDNEGVILNNRAMGVTVFFLINKLIDSKKGNVNKFIEFLKLFLSRLKEQIEKGIDIEPRYRELLNFQTYISQAAVEKYAIENRQKFLEEYFEYYLTHKKIKGDR